MVRNLLISAVIGLAITLLSWFLRPPLSRMGVDVVMRGAPLPWMTQVIPMAGSILWIGLVVDLAFWAAVIFGALMAMLHLGKGRATHHEALRTLKS